MKQSRPSHTVAAAIHLHYDDSRWWHLKTYIHIPAVIYVKKKYPKIYLCIQFYSDWFPFVSSTTGNQYSNQTLKTWAVYLAHNAHLVHLQCSRQDGCVTPFNVVHSHSLVCMVPTLKWEFFCSNWQLKTIRDATRLTRCQLQPILSQLNSRKF